MESNRPPFAPTILLLDDDPGVLQLLGRALQREPYETIAVQSGAQALEVLMRREVDLLVSDLEMPEISGLQLLEHIRRAGWDVDVIIVTGHASLDTAVACMRLSTVDFLKKPFDVADVQERVRRVLEKRLLRWENRALEARRGPEGPMLVGSSAAMGELREVLRRVAASDEVVLIRGESGTGKDLVARAIHAWGRRAAGPFLTVDCTTLSAAVVESELFGHAKGAFTGAEATRTGLFQAAGRGTVFLDEIGDFPLELQPKLLRALQEREVRAVGSNKAERFEGRIVAATHRDLEKFVQEGKFREDLYWRLNVVSVRVPPLRERREDVLELARHFVRRYDLSTDGPREIDPSAAEALKGYDWPGNVRELENCVRRLLVLRPDTLKLHDFVPPPRPESLGRADRPPPSPVVPPAPVRSEAPLADWEKTAVRSALAASRGNVTQAARALGISKSTLYRKMKAFGIEE